MRARISVIGVMFVGALASCETAQGNDPAGAGEGTTTQAATLTSKDDIVVSGVTYRREGALSCVIHDSSGPKDVMIVAGGVDDIGVVKSDIFSFDPSAAANSQWAKLSVTLSTARYAGFGFTIPTSTTDLTGTHCLFAGGRTSFGGGATNTTELLTFSSGTYSITSGGNMNTARSEFKGSICGTTADTSAKIIVAGGRDANTFKDGIEVWTYGTPGSWALLKDGSNNTITLGVPRASFAFAPVDNTYDQFLAVGGEDDTSIKSTVDIIEVTSACVYSDNATPTVSGLGARSRAALFPKGTGMNANKFVLTGGTSDGSDTLLTSDELSVTWASNTVSRAAGSSMASKRQLFDAVPMNTALTVWDVVGGLSGINSVGKTQIWDGATDIRWEDAAGTAGAEDTLNDARYLAAVQYLPSRSKVSVAAGLKLVAGAGTVLKSAEESP